MIKQIKKKIRLLKNLQKKNKVNIIENNKDNDDILNKYQNIEDFIKNEEQKEKKEEMNENKKYNDEDEDEE